MASSTMLLLPPYPSHSLSFCSRTPLFSIKRFKTHPRTAGGGGGLSASASSRALHALIFDCDGVILESEHLHRQAYNDAFTHFNVRCPSSSSSQSLVWSPEFYDVLQNQIGGGKPKMRWLFLILFLISPLLYCWNLPERLLLLLFLFIFADNWVLFSLFIELVKGILKRMVGRLRQFLMRLRRLMRIEQSWLTFFRFPYLDSPKFLQILIGFDLHINSRTWP